MVRPVVDAPTWTEALNAFATLGPPTGDVTENRRTVQHDAQHFGISKLFPVTQYGSDGLPRFTATSDEERTEYELTRQETFQLQFQQAFVAEALLRFPAHHQLPTAEELTTYFARSGLVSSPLAATLARAFLRSWAGDDEGAALTAAPQIEALARRLLLVVNAPLYRLQREQKPGQYPGLGFLLDQLQYYGLPESWYRYLYTLLTNPAGVNARHELAHGFGDYRNPGLAALLLQCAAFLTGLASTVSSSGSRPDDDQNSTITNGNNNRTTTDNGASN